MKSPCKVNIVVLLLPSISRIGDQQNAEYIKRFAPVIAALNADNSIAISPIDNPAAYGLKPKDLAQIVARSQNYGAGAANVIDPNEAEQYFAIVFAAFDSQREQGLQIDGSSADFRRAITPTAKDIRKTLEIITSDVNPETAQLFQDAYIAVTRPPLGQEATHQQKLLATDLLRMTMSYNLKATFGNELYNQFVQRGAAAMRDSEHLAQNSFRSFALGQLVPQPVITAEEPTPSAPPPPTPTA